MTDLKNKSDDYWKKKLTADQYWVLRQKGTEPPFSGKLLNNEDTGMYQCGACGAELFHSKTKFESTLTGLEGWPSFSDITHSDAVKLVDDNSFGMKRKEVLCTSCGSHLGHLFDDPGSTTGKHYCINSCALNFKKEK